MKIIKIINLLNLDKLKYLLFKEKVLVIFVIYCEYNMINKKSNYCRSIR